MDGEAREVWVTVYGGSNGWRSMYDGSMQECKNEVYARM